LNNVIEKTQKIPEFMVMARVNRDKLEKERVKEFLLVPLSIKSKRIGLLTIGAVDVIGQNDVDLLTSIANNAAVAFENALLYDTSKKYFFRTIDALIAAVEAKDKYTEGHSQRVARYAEMIARHLGLPREQIEEIKIAGILHDVGKIGISDSILSKPGKLTEEEYDEIKLHPGISNKILYPVGFSERTLQAIAFHHERYDGKGYPHGLKGDSIAFEAQIIAVADAYDAMTSDRSYRSAMSRHAAIRELETNKATQFTPLIVDTFIDAIGRWESSC
jgi:putative nucleotidyltransferase with HDIG domain